MSAESTVPHNVERFVRDYITSVAQLEVLLLLAERSDVDWSAREASRELRNAPDHVARILADLRDAGILIEAKPQDSGTAPTAGAPRFQFQPQSDSVRHTVEALIPLYRQRRYTLLDLIYARPADSGSNSNLRAFSDAFRLRRKEDD